MNEAGFGFDDSSCQRTHFAGGDSGYGCTSSSYGFPNCYIRNSGDIVCGSEADYGDKYCVLKVDKTFVCYER